MRIGLFGGAFDPPHLGHCSMLLFVSQKLRFDKTLVIPTGNSPHKSTVASFSERFKMAEMSFLPLYEVSKLEKSSKISYTVDTLLKLKKTYPNDELFLVIGGDMLAAFDRWREYKRILELCTVVAAAREENHSELQMYAERFGVVLSDIPILPLSSSEIRKRLANGEDITNLVRPDVYNYIKRKKLY